MLGMCLFTRNICINTIEIYVEQIGIFVPVGTVTISPWKVDIDVEHYIYSATHWNSSVTESPKKIKGKFIKN